MKNEEIKHSKAYTYREKHRLFIVFSGGRQWTTNAAITCLQQCNDQVWITDQVIDSAAVTVSAKKTNALLGTEAQTLVFDAFAGFNIDALGIASGIVRGGGAIILLTPDFEQWPMEKEPENQRLFGRSTLPHPARFITRTCHILRSSQHVHIFQEGDTSKQERFSKIDTSLSSPSHTTETVYSDGAITEEQHIAITRMTTTLKKKGKRSLVLTSHRGRGKTAALGLVAASLLKHTTKPINILVTAPKINALRPLFSCAKKQLALSEDNLHLTPSFTASAIHTMKGSLTFAAPDTLTLTYPPADIVFVDEAAAIPVPLLTKLLDNYPKIIFASTIHGYEGTGRGFAIRFKDILDKRRPNTPYYHIHTPVRWADNDPTEQLLFRLLGLNSQPISDKNALTAYAVGKITYRILSQASLLQDTFLLEQLFGLLVLSHYQTRPSDFRQLLDAPNVSIHTLLSEKNNLLLGAALVFHEGEIASTYHKDILMGKRRLRGQLLPQTLAIQCNIEAALSLKGARIQRIAIHPALHKRGLGSQLLDHTITTLKNKESIDYVGSSFGLTCDLLAFWQKNTFHLAGIGSGRDASSGCHAATVIQGLSSSGVEVTRQARQAFAENLPYQLKEPLKSLEPDLCMATLKQSLTPSLGHIHRCDTDVLIAYAEGYRLYDYALPSLSRFLWHSMTHHQLSASISTDEKKLLLMKIAQGHSWETCIRTMQLTGKKQTDTMLRMAFKKILRKHLDTIA